MKDDKSSVCGVHRINEIRANAILKNDESGAYARLEIGERGTDTTKNTEERLHGDTQNTNERLLGDTQNTNELLSGDTQQTSGCESIPSPAHGVANKSGHNFYAFISRMKYINRWVLMRNTLNENIQEHSLQVAIIAHSLALINNIYFGGDVDADKAAVLGIFHDCDEIITGDLPTPVKYFNPEIREAYRVVEGSAKETLLGMLPEGLETQYRKIFYQDENEHIWKIVKAADTLSAYIKCVEEMKAGNSEFSAASDSIMNKLKVLCLPEVDFFMKEFLGGFKLSLDEFGI